MIVCFTAESCLCDGNRYNGSKRQEEMTEIRSHTITDFQWEIVLLKIHWISTVSTNKFWKTASSLSLTKTLQEMHAILWAISLF